MSTSLTTSNKDTFIALLNPTVDSGGETTSRIGANAAGTTVVRALFAAGNLTSDYSIPVGSTINSAILALNVTTGAASAVPTWSMYRMTRAWTEGTSNLDGATWLQWQFNANATLNQWTTAGGDFTVTGGSTGLLFYTSTGSKTFDITAVIQACLDNGGDVNLIAKRDTESGTASTMIFDSRTGGTPWTIVVTFTPPPSGDPSQLYDQQPMTRIINQFSR